MDITKLRLLKQKNGNGLELSYERPGPSGDKIAVNGETHTAIIHNDLYNAIQSLSVHLALMAFHVKEVEDIAMPDANLFKDFTVGSFNISGKEEKRGIIISGTLRKNGKAHNFNTPFYRFEEPPAARYTYMDDLEAKLRVVESLVPAYLDGTQRGEPLQPELGMPEKKAEVKTDFVGGENGLKKAEEKKTAKGKGKAKEEKKIEGPKVTEEGNLAPASAKHKYADKDAMDRVAELGTEGDEAKIAES